MLSKQQLLDNLGTLDRVKLDKLWSYADLLLIPEEDLLINVTMKQTLDKVFALADVHFPEWTDRSHADFGRFLAELFCLFSEKDFWYVNSFANEAFLHKMRIYGNAYYRSLELGYQPILYASAKCQISLTFSAGSNLNIKPGDVKIKINDLTLSNTQSFTVDAVGTQVVVTEFAVGSYQTKTTEYNGRSVVLPDNGIDLTSVSVKINSVAWNRVLSFSASSPTDKVFFALPDENAAATVLFGDGVFGAKPNVGDSIVTLYRVGGGAMADISSSTPTVQESPTGRTITAVSQTTTLTGGADQEPLSRIKANAPVYFRTGGRITNESDGIAVLQMQPEVKKAQCILWATTLQFYVIPSAGGVASPALLSTLENRLRKQVLMGFTFSGVSTTYISLSPMKVTAYITPGYQLEDVCSQIASLIQSYTDPESEAVYGRYFKFGLFTGHLVSNISGLENVVVDEVNGNPASGYSGAQIILAPSEITDKVDIGTSFTTSIITGGLQYVAGDLTIDAIYST